MESEVHEITTDFENETLILEMISYILSTNVEIEAFVDWKTVFHLVAKDGKSTERRLQIDISSMHESYENGELASICWIQGGINPSVAFMKPVIKKPSPLRSIITTNEIDQKAIGW